MLNGVVNLLKNFGKIQEEMKKIKDELAGKEVTGVSGAGMVEVTINGKFEMIDIRIEKKLMKGDDPEMLQELIVGAVNDALGKVQMMIKDSFQQLTGGLNLPDIGLPGIFG